MSLVDKHPDHDPDCDDAQGATSRFGSREVSPIVSKKPSEILRERRQRIRRRCLTTAGVLLALVLSAVYVWGPFHSPHKPKLRSQGYTGTHTDTGRPSPKWANGTDIAWKLDHYAMGAGEYAAMKNGDQVILALPLRESDRFKVVSLDVSGTEPAIQWNSVVSKAVPRNIEPHLVMVGEDLFVGEHRLDPTTGAASPAPWAGRNQDGQDKPELATTIVITSRDGLVIACSRRICSGWEKEDGEWTMRWERDSTPTPLEDYQDCPECGEGTWVPLNDLQILRWGPAAENAPLGGFFDPVAQEGHIINTQTGEVRALHDVNHNHRFELHSTADGWVVADSKTDAHERAAARLPHNRRGPMGRRAAAHPGHDNRQRGNGLRHPLLHTDRLHPPHPRNNYLRHILPRPDHWRMSHGCSERGNQQGPLGHPHLEPLRR